MRFDEILCSWHRRRSSRAFSRSMNGHRALNIIASSRPPQSMLARRGWRRNLANCAPAASQRLYGRSRHGWRPDPAVAVACWACGATEGGGAAARVVAEEYVIQRHATLALKTSRRSMGAVARLVAYEGATRAFSRAIGTANLAHDRRRQAATSMRTTMIHSSTAKSSSKAGAARTVRGSALRVLTRELTDCP